MSKKLIQNWDSAKQAVDEWILSIMDLRTAHHHTNSAIKLIQKRVPTENNCVLSGKMPGLSFKYTKTEGLNLTKLTVSNFWVSEFLIYEIFSQSTFNFFYSIIYKQPNSARFGGAPSSKEDLYHCAPADKSLFQNITELHAFT